MQFKSRLALAAALGALVSLSSVSARALTLQVDLVRTDLGENISFKANGTTTNTYAGQIYSQLDSGSGSTYTTPYAAGDTFCLDLYTHNSIGDKFLAMLSNTNASNLHNGGEIAYLYNKYELGLYGVSNVVTTNDQAAALQLAMWKLIYDNTTSMSSGTIQDTTAGTVLTDTQNYLTDAAAHPYTSEANWLDATYGGTQSPTGQGQCGPTAVPESGLFGLLGSLTSVGAVLRYRRARALKRQSGKRAA